MKTPSPSFRLLEKGTTLKPREIWGSSRSIKETVREAGKEAQAQSLTEEVLREILNEQ